MRYRLGLILACFAIGYSVSGSQEPEQTILGAPTAFDLSGEDAETVWVGAETRLYRQPAQRSPVLITFPSGVELPVLERRPGWARIRFSSWQGWVPVEGEAGGMASDLPTEMAGSAEPWWAPRIEADREHLERARAFLEDGFDSEHVIKLGGYRLYTDLTDDELLARLARVAERLPRTFEQRFNLEANIGDSDTVVLYKADASYRAYIETGEDPAAVGSLGHAIGGLAVLTVGDLEVEEVQNLLIHELTHVLTYHALGPDLPGWLVEGMAEDLAYSRLTRGGEIQLGTLGSWRSAASTPFRQLDGQTRFLITMTRGGAEASLEDLRQKRRQSQAATSQSTSVRIPSLEELVSLPAPDFMAFPSRQVHYSSSAFLIRYLLDFPESSGRFHAFLRAVAVGDLGNGDNLLAHLAISWADLEAGFSAWLESSAPKRGTKSKKKHDP